jgi:hypothetical protein
MSAAAVAAVLDQVLPGQHASGSARECAPHQGHGGHLAAVLQDALQALLIGDQHLGLGVVQP